MLQRPRSSAVVVRVSPRNVADTVSSGAAAPQTWTGRPRCTTMWSASTDGNVTSANAQVEKMKVEKMKVEKVEIEITMSAQAKRTKGESCRRDLRVMCKFLGYEKADRMSAL